MTNVGTIKKIVFPVKSSVSSIEKKMSKQEIIGSNEYVFVNTKSANISEYKKWLEGYLVNGGKVSSFDETFNSHPFRLVTKDIKLKALTSTELLHLIINKGVEIDFIDGGIGHCKLFYMDDFRYEGSSSSLPPMLE